MRTRLWEARSVHLSHRTPGVLRPARPDEASLCHEWCTRFAREAHDQAGRRDGPHHDGGLDRAEVRLRIAQQTLWVLEDESGQVVHLTGRNGPEFGVARIGPVYTPPEHRGRGYASDVVGRLTAEGLTQGWRMCLYTDQANPVSNGIYEALGYRPVADQAELVITAAS